MESIYKFCAKFIELRVFIGLEWREYFLEYGSLSVLLCCYSMDCIWAKEGQGGLIAVFLQAKFLIPFSAHPELLVLRYVNVECE